ncbi:MAG TPA: tetratricopeptide repeat protein [Blastocatellia bacterium]|nr:tetratricopeptide repeat protein [Blastocatellia bacterium]
MSVKPHLAWLIVVVIFITAAPVAAYQSTTKKEDEAKAREERRKQALGMTDEIIKNAQALRLPENRLRLLLAAASAVWSADEKRAHLLIKSAQESLNELQAAIDSHDPQYASLDSLVAQLRQEMLNTVAQQDPELALEMLHAMPQRNGGQPPSASFEAQLELQLAQRLASKDAARALDLGERGLAKGVSYELLNLANTLHATNREAGQKLFDDILARLQTENFATNRVAIYVALNLLREWSQPHNPADEPEANNTRFMLSDQAARNLCGTILSAVLDNSTSTSMRVPAGSTFDMLRQLQPMLPAIEKLQPTQAATLEARLADMQRFNEMQNGPWVKVQEMIKTASVGEMVSAAGNWPPEMQNYLLQTAAWKAYNDGNTEQARQIIEEKITDPRIREQMQENIERQKVERLIGEGKISEARALLPRLASDPERISYYIRLATAALSKGNKQEAEQLLNEALAVAGGRAENYQMLYAQLMIANTYRALDVSQSSAIIESAIDRLNQLTAAAATLNGFDVQQYFRNDEFVLSNGNPLNQLLQQIGAQLSGVAEQDADRARALADRVERLEMKTWLLLRMLPALLSESGSSSTESLQLSPRRFSQVTPMMLTGPVLEKR